MVKLVAVFGATGLQGGSVARALLKSSKYKVRVVTRKPRSKKAVALRKLGAEVVKADLDDKNSIDSVMTGCYGVFGVTNYWEYFDVDREYNQGKAMVDAAKAASVKHFIFSGLEKVNEIFGKPCAHFDGKGRVEEYLMKSGMPATVVRYADFMENFIRAPDFYIKKDGQTRLLDIPIRGTPVDFICASEAGTAIAAIFNKPSEYIGKTLGITGDSKSTSEYGEILSKVFPQWTFKASTTTPEDMSKVTDIEGAKDLAAMFEFYGSGKCIRDLQLTRKLDPNTKTFEQWVIANKDELEGIFE